MGNCLSRSVWRYGMDNEEPEEHEVNEEHGDLVLEEIKKINKYLLSLYENELKFKRPEDEVKCITSSVEIIVDSIMTAVGKECPESEISQQYMVGSMAEGTSIIEPNEFDFLVTLKHFSNRSDINLTAIHDCYYKVKINDQPVDPICFSTKLHKVILSRRFQELYSNVKSEYGNLSIKSTTVCEHGPASVIKLMWQPSTKMAEPFDILVDITPFIEQQGVDTAIQASDVAIPAHYEALVRDDKYILVGLPWDTKPLISSFTTTEVKIIRNLSAHHKMCFMLLKYCLNDVIVKDIYNTYQSAFSSYKIKTFVLRHAAICDTITNDKTEMRSSLYTCLFDILRDMQRNMHLGEYYVDGIFGKICGLSGLFSSFQEPIINFQIENTLQILVQIGKQGNTSYNYLKFQKTCHRDSIHPAVQARADRLARDNVECHLSHRCKIHKKYI